jgi:sugar phosphate isomerase/epimerase
MQGRLSAQSDRGYQAFPWATWQHEFDLAAGRGLEHIEWVLDAGRVEENPILVETSAVVDHVHESGIQVVSVCADYLMDDPLDLHDPYPWKVLSSLVVAMQRLGAESLVVPCVDRSSLRDHASSERLVRAADSVVKKLEGTNIRVSLEADLDPGNFAHLLTNLDPEFFSVNYDIGNSAYLGYSFEEEFDAYGDRISLVHIKDRLFEGGSVLLGQGSADLVGVIDRLRKIAFDGPVTMEAFRDSDGLEVLDTQLDWILGALTGI